MARKKTNTYYSWGKIWSIYNKRRIQRKRLQTICLCMRKVRKKLQYDRTKYIKIPK